MTAALSRFAVLKIENDEEEKAAQRARDRERAAALKAAGKTKNVEKPKQTAEKIVAKKVKASKERAELKALAFGGTKHKKTSHNNGTKQSQPNKSHPSIQREAPSEWKQKDEEFVEDAYEQQLKEALLASRLEFEEKKEIYKAHEQEAKAEQKLAKKKQGNKKGTTTFALDEFKLQLSQASAAKEPEQTNADDDVEDEHFFEKVTEEAKKIASYEKVKVETSNKKKTKPSTALEISDEPRIAQLDEDLRKAKEEISSLREENEKLHEDLLGVKTRNKRLCNILAQGEMREKAELLIEMEKLSTIKDELTAEVENLLGQLQQERSKSNTLSDAKKVYALKKMKDSGSK